jgi:Uma2 family endonuclease
MSTISDPLLFTGLPVLVTDVTVSAQMIEERRARGADRFDEVWDGVYVMAPAPNDEHQDIGLGLGSIFREVIQRTALGRVRLAINLAISKQDWGRDYRVPDLAIFLTGSPSACHGAFWTGSPDFVVEIASPGDQTREKIGFYDRIGTRELLIIDRNPWQLELLRLDAGKLVTIGVCTLDAPLKLCSERAQLAFELVPGEERPQIAVEHTNDGRTWIV